MLKPLLTEDLLSCFDLGVNKTTQNFRTPGSTKSNGRKKQVYKQYSYFDAIVTLIPEHAVALPSLAPMKAAAEIVTENIPAEKLEILRGLIDVTIWRQDNKRSRGNKVMFNQLVPSHCELCNRMHDHSAMYVCVFDTCMRIFCY